MAGKSSWKGICMGLEPLKATKQQERGRALPVGNKNRLVLVNRPGALDQWELLWKFSQSSPRLHMQLQSIDISLSMAPAFSNEKSIFFLCLSYSDFALFRAQPASISPFYLPPRKMNCTYKCSLKSKAEETTAKIPGCIWDVVNQRLLDTNQEKGDHFLQKKTMKFQDQQLLLPEMMSRVCNPAVFPPGPPQSWKGLQRKAHSQGHRATI